ncbi:hypothetical protein MMC12_007878 [Toensbergia leucococca]|nr:hypothetical protein [Toensbergia leucococca]
MAAFTDTLFYGLVIPFVPIILEKRIGIGSDEIQKWNSVLLGVYGGANLVASPICGYVADRMRSYQSPLLFGLAAMGVATALLHLGSTIELLVVARAFQGLAAAIVLSAGLALLKDSVKEHELGEAMGYVSLAITAGTFLGPTLGGVLYQYSGKTVVFSLAYAVLAVDVVLRSMVVEKSPANSSESSAGDSDYGTMDRRPLSPNVGSESAVDADFLQPQAKYPSFVLLKAPRLLTAFMGWFVVGTVLSAFDTVLPIFVQSTFTWSSAGAGVIFLPLFIPNIAGPLYGRLVDSSRQAGRMMATAGFTLCLPFFVLLRLVSDDSVAAQVLLCGLLFMIGLGLALSGTPLFVEVGRAVSAIEQQRPGIFGSKGASALAYGLLNCAFAGGQLLGPLWAGLVTSTLGWATMTWMLGVACGLTGISMALFLGGWIVNVARKSTEVHGEM